MIKFCDGIKHLYLPHLNEINHNISAGVNSWLQKGADYFVGQNQLNNDFTVSTYEYSDFLRPYAFDINRLSCASLESLKDIERKTWQPKFIAWNITKFYYSAFFSAHCILKVTGNSLVNIESPTLEKVRSVTRNYGFNYGNLNSGLYLIDINPLNNHFRFYKNPIYDNSHEGLWRRFLDFLTNIQPGIYGQLPLADAQSVVDKIDELRTALTNWNTTTGNWLSRVRNLVNYSQSYGSWFPYKEYIAEHDRIYAYIKLHHENPLKIDIAGDRGKDILYFVKTCQIINAISLDLLTDLEKKHPANKSFVLNGISKFQKLYM